MSNASALDWTDLDEKAVDTARVLAMDAVQKVGNGHPGTAMSLAPAAYLLFQKVMRHDPADPRWIARDRFVLSCGHSSITLYTQLYLGGFGLELEDLKALRTWGSKTPGHPELHHTAGVEVTTGPLGQGVANAVGMAMSARRVHGLLDPEAAPGESLFDHHVYVALLRRRPPGGRQRRGQLDRRHPGARQPDGDLRPQPDLDRGRHRHRVHRGRRQALRGLRLARAGRRLDQRRHGVRRGRPRAVRRDHRGRRGRPTSRRSSCSTRSSPGPRPTPRAPRRPTAARSATTRSRPPRRSSAGTPSRPSRCRRTSSPTPATLRERGAAWGAEWDEQYDAWSAGQPRHGRRSCTGSRRATLPEGLADALPTFEASEKGVATRAASGEVINAIAPLMPELWGGSADLAGSNNTTIKSAPSFLPTEPGDRGVERPTPTRAGCCTSASASTAWARS